MGRVQDRKKDSVLEEVDENKDGPKPRNIIVKSWIFLKEDETKLDEKIEEI